MQVSWWVTQPISDAMSNTDSLLNACAGTIANDRVYYFLELLNPASCRFFVMISIDFVFLTIF